MDFFNFEIFKYKLDFFRGQKKQCFYVEIEKIFHFIEIHFYHFASKPNNMAIK